jgi:uncharacterized membrane protein YdjX (TVP38/TMEM64 family)
MPGTGTSGRTRWWRWLAVVAVLALVALASRHVDLAAALHPETIRALIAPFGAWGPLVFSVFKIITMLLCVPLSTVSIAAGLLFGFGWGLVINVITNLIGSVIAFAIARRLGGDAVRSRLTGRWAAFHRAMDADGFTFLFVMRLTPVFPFNIVSYAVAVTGLRWRVYLLATALGMLPTTAVYSYVGAAAGEASLGKLAVALTLLALVSILPKLRRWRAEADPA